MSTNEIDIDNKEESGIKKDDIKHTTECVQPLDFCYQGPVIIMDTSSWWMKRADESESSDLDKDQFSLVNNGTLAADLQMVVVDPSPEE